MPILQGLMGSGMGKGPALAGPALSLPSMLVLRQIMGTENAGLHYAGGDYDDGNGDDVRRLVLKKMREPSMAVFALAGFCGIMEGMDNRQ